MCALILKGELCKNFYGKYSLLLQFCLMAAVAQPFNATVHPKMKTLTPFTYSPEPVT